MKTTATLAAITALAFTAGTATAAGGTTPSYVAQYIKTQMNKELAFAHNPLRVTRARCISEYRGFFCIGNITDGRRVFWNVRLAPDGSFSWTGKVVAG